MSEIPTGAKLDLLVLWAVGYYHAEPGYNGSSDLEAIVGAKAGLDSQSMVSRHDGRNILRSIDRLLKADTGAGYRLAALS